MNPNEQRVAERFPAETAGFVIEVLHEDLEYRHLRFGRPGDRNLVTHVHTWPGGVATSGDMGDGFVFGRSLDFFATGVTPALWEGKTSPTCVTREFSPEIFAATVREETPYGSVPPESRIELTEAVELLIATVVEGYASEHSALDQVEDFEFYTPDKIVTFPEDLDWDVTDYTCDFLWACHVLHAVATSLDTPDERLTRQPDAVYECPRCGRQKPAGAVDIFHGCSEDAS